MGMVDWTTNTTNYIGDVNPWLPRGHVAGLAQSGSVTDAFIHAPGSRIGYSRIVSIGAEAVLDLCDYLAYCLDDPETHAVMLFVEGFKRPERFLALADRALAIGQADPRRQGGPVAPGPGRGHRAQRQPRGRGPGDRRGARRGGRHPVRRPRRAAGAGGADRRRRAGWAARVGPRPDGRRDGLDRGGVARRRPGGRGPGIDLPPVPDAARDGDPARACRRWATSATRWIPWGADEESRAYRVALRGARGVRRVRRPGDRPRLAVPRPAERGPGGQRRERRR